MNELEMRLLEEAQTTEMFKRFAALNGRIVEEGNEWCAIVGEMPNNCIAGFGKSPMLALNKWHWELYKTKPDFQLTPQFKQIIP